MADFKIQDRRFAFNAAEKQQFDQAFRQKVTEQEKSEEETLDPKAVHKGKLYSDHLSELGWHLDSLWNEARGYRIHIEQRWLNDLRQYRGEYEPYVKGRIHPKRSKAFIRLTRTKVKTVNARLSDILFPGGRTKNWGIEPTPLPEFPPEMVDQLMTAVQQQVGADVEVTTDMVKEIIREDAKLRANAMEREMEDQLAEIKYRETIRKVLHSGNLYGTGILKGPLVKKKTYKRWQQTGEEGEWSIVRNDKIIPTCEFVPIWDIYPDMSAVEPDNATYIFQRYTMSRNKVVELANRPDFNGEAIRAYLDENKDGDAKYEDFENFLRNINQDNKFGKTTTRNEGDPQGMSVARLHKKYNLKEFWGYLAVDQLIDQGVEVPNELADQQEVAANVWMLGPLVIKAVLSPIEGIDLPYHFYYYDKDETSIFGEGISAIMRDPQELSNAAVRALLDNAAISAGPIIEANIDLLADGEDPLDIHPFRVFQRTGVGAEASANAINVQYQRAYTGDFLEMLNTFIQMGDEVTTVPRYMWGESGGVQGAGRTATGLSMLMGSVNITLKDQVKNFDDGVTKPYIKAHYFWNMEFNPKPEIKGDFNIVAKGTGSLIAKEVKLETLVKYLQVISSFPQLIQSVDVKKLNDELTEVLELDPITKTEAQLRAEADQAAQSQAEDKEFTKTMEIMKAASGGHIDTEQLQQIMGALNGKRT